MQTISYGRQYIDSADIKEVVEALKSEWITQGPKVKEFEDALASYCGCRYAVAVSSGTAALHLACLAVGLKMGDEAITSPITFLATANSILYTGAKVVFADIDYDSVNIDPHKIREGITKRTKAILPVHFGGLPCDIAEISNIAKKNNLMVIEDACHALSSEYRGERIGSCRYSDMAAFSFHPVKNITTGEGGVITTNSRRLYERLLALRSHGVSRKKGTLRRYGGWYYEMECLGLNYRLTAFQSALGISQLRKLGRFLRKREAIAERYNSSFREFEDVVKIPSYDAKEKRHSWHLYILRIKTKSADKKRRFLYEYLIKRNIHTQIHYIPVPNQPYYRGLGYRPENYPVAQSYYKECLSLPVFYSLKEGEQRRVINIIKVMLRRLRQGKA